MSIKDNVATKDTIKVGQVSSELVDFDRTTRKNNCGYTSNCVQESTKGPYKSLNSGFSYKNLPLRAHTQFNKTRF